MSRNWFIDKLGGEQPRPYVPPQQVQQAAPQHVSPDGQWVWNGREWVPNAPTVPAPPERLSPKAQQAKRLHGDEPCPQCGIDDTFFSPPGRPNAAKRCFSCGYNQADTAIYNSTAFDSSTGGTHEGAAPVRNQATSGWTGMPKNPDAYQEHLQ